jgi:hypothetical protein
VRTIERLSFAPQGEARLLGCHPRCREILGVEGKKQVPIVGREHGPGIVRVVVRAPHADHHITNATPTECADERVEGIHRHR